MSRPVYVPRGKRQLRLHGAFTGGFSAGYFNTVGSREGWTPQTPHEPDSTENDNTTKKNSTQEDADNEDRKHQQQQRLEDFMDEQDHNEWGGPIALHQAYQATVGDGIGAIGASNTAGAFDEAFSLQMPTANIGLRLLRLLGYRDGAEAALVPAEHDRFFVAGKTKNGNNDNKESVSAHGEDDDEEERKHLSKRRLRKIRLQQKRVVMPQPKLDRAGLGFEPFENAPEFKAHRDRRRQLAQERAQDNSRKVYRVSDVLGEVKEEEQQRRVTKKRGPSKREDPDGGDPYVSFETAEDFAGYKSVGGFALREDDDDAYDDRPISDKAKIDRDAYDTVVYEHESGDEDHHHSPTGVKESSGAAGFGSFLSSWAKVASAKETIATSTARTSDGRPPLSGFVSGGTDSISSPSRFRGPDIPSDYIVRRHVFAEDEHPLVIKALSHAEQLISADRNKEAAVEEALASNAAVHAPGQTRALVANGIFAGLSSALTSRFAPETTCVEMEPARAPGLSFSIDLSSLQEMSRMDDDKIDKNMAFTITITRTVLPFVPEALVSKRLHVKFQSNATATTVSAVDHRSQEEAYFYDEIVPKAVQEQSRVGVKVAGTVGKADCAEDDEYRKDIHADRPSVEFYKSIFEQTSDDLSSTSNDGDEEGHQHCTSSVVSTRFKSVMPTTPDPVAETRLVSYETSKEAEGEESVKRKIHDQRSQSLDSSDISRWRRKRSRRDDRKGKKRHHLDDTKHNRKRPKSSKHKRDR
jgi:hypothetical protein